MKIGVFGTLTDQGIKIDELATAVEERGFESLWIGEHTHVPVAVASHPKEGKKPLPDFYKRLPDPFVQLGAAAAVTERIRLGTSVSLISEHDPIVLAKQVATVDFLSNGRFEFGVGYGWNELEMRHHGVDVRQKRPVFKEKLLAMRNLWEQEEAGFQGEFVKFEPSYAWPKPVQQRIPVHIGAEAGPKTINDIVELCEGWLPMALRGGDDRFPTQYENLKKHAEASGKSMEDFDISMMDPLLAFDDVSPEDFRSGMQQSVGRSLVEEYKLNRLIIGIPFFDRDRALAHLDSAAEHYLRS